MLKKFLLTLFAFCLINSANADTLSLIQISDVHFPKRDYLGYEGRDLSLAIPNYERAIKQINSDKEIEAVFFTGDFTDRSLEEVYIDFFKTTKNLKKKYYLAFGNHDVNSIAGFNKEQAISFLKDNTDNFKNNGSYVVELNKNIVAIVLDGAFDVEMSARGEYTKNTLKWLKEELDKNKDKFVIIFQHFPIVEPEKDSLYINTHRVKNKWRYTKLIKKYDNILFIASGHYHVAGEFEKYGTKHYSTPALFLTPSYYRKYTIDYKENNINKIETELVEIK